MPASPAPRPSSDPPLPATIGRYEIVRVLGEGAMGRVLLAHDPVLDRDVAVKHLRGDLKIPREVREGLLTRMRHEARAAARVPHPNLVVLHDMGEDASVGLFLVFEFVDGPNLKAHLKRDGRLPPGDAAKLAVELGGALSTAHEAGILHRDIKPENVMLARTGGKIADFGIARIPDSTLTHQGGLMGTPAYSAPETFRAGKFSPASDQFSLAATMYEAISGRRAFPGDDAVAVASKIAHDDAEAFASALGLPPAVDEVLARALSRTPEDRFPSCEAFGAALAKSLTLPAAVSAREGGAVAPAAASAPRERKLGQVALGALVVLATAALLMRAALRSTEADSARAAASALPSASSKPARPRPPSPAPRPRPRPEVPASAQPAPGPSGAAPVAPGSAAPPLDAGP